MKGINRAKLTITAGVTLFLIALPLLSASAKPDPALAKELTVAEIANLPFGPERQRLLEEGGKKEGVLYHLGALRGIEEMVKPFLAKYPWLEFKPLVLGTAPLVERVLAEAKADKLGADVLGLSVGGYLELAHLLQEFRSPGAKFIKKAPKAPLTSTLLVVFAYSTARVKKADLPKKLEDFLQPQWKGRLGFLAPPNIFPASWVGTLLEFWGQEKTKTFLTTLGKQNIMFNKSAPALDEDVLKGEFDIAMTASSIATREYLAGKPIDWIALDPTWGSQMFDGLVKKARHPYAAMLFLDWVVSNEGQAMISDFMGYVTADQIAKRDVHGRKLPQNIRFDIPEDEPLKDGWNKLFLNWVVGR